MPLLKTFFIESRRATATRSGRFAVMPDALRYRLERDGIAHDQSILDRPEDAEIQLDRQYDYRTNVDACADWLARFREDQPPLLAVRAENDPFLGPEVARAFAGHLMLRSIPPVAGISLWKPVHQRSPQRCTTFLYAIGSAGALLAMTVALDGTRSTSISPHPARVGPHRTDDHSGYTEGQSNS